MTGTVAGVGLVGAAGTDWLGPADRGRANTCDFVWIINRLCLLLGARPA